MCGRYSASSAQLVSSALFARADADGSGAVTRQELSGAMRDLLSSKKQLEPGRVSSRRRGASAESVGGEDGGEARGGEGGEGGAAADSFERGYSSWLETTFLPKVLRPSPPYYNPAG